MNWRRETKYNIRSEESYRVCFVRIGPMLETPERRFYEAWTPSPRGYIGKFDTPEEAKAACEDHDREASREDT